MPRKIIHSYEETTLLQDYAEEARLYSYEMLKLLRDVKPRKITQDYVKEDNTLKRH
jgi:hypothetical protein